jgi:hypothetical protein
MSVIKDPGSQGLFSLMLFQTEINIKTILRLT